jgi:4a-hydroxytetrahydrobiopterin dehydratase
MSDWAGKRCKPCEGGAAPLASEEARTLLGELDPAWELDEERHEIRRSFSFKGYHQTIGFVNAVAWIANRENHHPDLEVGYNRCLVRYKTHVLGGLSENDFICAAKVDRLLREE